MICKVCGDKDVHQIKNLSYLYCFDCICEDIASQVLNRSIQRLKRKNKDLDNLIKDEYSSLLRDLRCQM